MYTASHSKALITLKAEWLYPVDNNRTIIRANKRLVAGPSHTWKLRFMGYLSLSHLRGEGSKGKQMPSGGKSMRGQSRENSSELKRCWQMWGGEEQQHLPSVSSSATFGLEKHWIDISNNVKWHLENGCPVCVCFMFNHLSVSEELVFLTKKSCSQISGW